MTYQVKCISKKINNKDVTKFTFKGKGLDDQPLTFSVDVEDETKFKEVEVGAEYSFDFDITVI